MAEQQGQNSQTNPPRLLKVFLCHAGEDKARVRELYRKLRADGVEPWLDEESLLAGQRWEDAIVEAVESSDVVIVCLSPQAVSEAGFRHREIKLALDTAEEQPEGTIFLIPLKLADCELPRRLREYHWVNYYEPDGHDKLLRALKERAGKLGLPAPKTVPETVPPESDARPAATILTLNALHQLPPPPRDFTGRREELEELMSKIERGGVTISGLHGLGGIGKTALALKFAEALKPRYPEAQFYLDLKGVSERPATAAEALSHVIRAYHPTARLPEGEEDLRALYLSVLHGQRALILMDNASGREQVEPLIPPESCVLLVTSRKHFHLQGLSPLSLDTLRPEDARDLLLKIAPRIGDRADDIAALCGHLPLALQLAGGALAERVNLPPADYLPRLPA